MLDCSKFLKWRRWARQSVGDGRLRYFAYLTTSSPLVWLLRAKTDCAMKVQSRMRTKTTVRKTQQQTYCRPKDQTHAGCIMIFGASDGAELRSGELVSADRR